jgi:hypothetical protein
MYIWQQRLCTCTSRPRHTDRTNGVSKVRLDASRMCSTIHTRRPTRRQWPRSSGKTQSAYTSTSAERAPRRSALQTCCLDRAPAPSHTRCWPRASVSAAEEEAARSHVTGTAGMSWHEQVGQRSDQHRVCRRHETAGATTDSSERWRLCFGRPRMDTDRPGVGMSANATRRASSPAHFSCSVVAS